MIILFICLGVVFYILYIQGILVVNSKTAVTFVGSIRGNGHCQASFTSCNGEMKRVIKFKESKAYRFTLTSELEKGEIDVMVLDSSKQPVMLLNYIQPSAVVEVDKKRRYYLVLSFKSASGTYKLKWE